jgi:hypothetical protein
MIEAMACGTPVVAFRAGSVPEVIENGVTGFIVDSEEEAVRAIRLVGKLNRRQIRRTFERRFTAHRMAEDYVQLYRRLTSKAVLIKKPVAPIDMDAGLSRPGINRPSEVLETETNEMSPVNDHTGGTRTAPEDVTGAK